MKNKMKWLLLVLLSLFMLASCFGCGKAGENAEKDLSANSNENVVIAIVNGTDITRTELTKRVDMLASSMAMQYGMEISRDEFPEFYENMKDIAFDDLVIGILLDEEASKEGYSVNNNEVDTYIYQLSSYAEEYLGKTLEEYLSSISATEEDMRIEYARNSYIGVKREAFAEEAEVTENEIVDYYNNNTSEFITKDGIEISHILVETEEEANDIIAQINAGSDFASMASEKSIDPGSASNGGMLGTVNEDTNFVEEFKTAALALEPGEMTQTPVKSDYGYHIIKAGARVEASVTSLEDAHDYIESQIRNSKAQSDLEKYSEELKNNAEIKDMRESIDKTQLSKEDDDNVQK